MGFPLLSTLGQQDTSRLFWKRRKRLLLDHWFFVYVYSVASVVWLLATLWTVACHAPLSMGFSRQEYWSGLPFPPPGDLPNPGIKLESPASPALVGRFFINELSGIWVVPKEFGHFSHPQTAGIRILNILSAILVAWFLAQSVKSYWIF